MAFNGIPMGVNKDASIVGRAGQAAIVPQSGIYIDGLFKFLNDLQKADDRFNTEMKKAAFQVAKKVLDNAQLAASTVAHNRQALEVARGLRVKDDRIPIVYLKGDLIFRSTSRAKVRGSRGRMRTRRVLMSDVFFGAEFGGQKRRTTQQFPPHRGKEGYFFWPTVRRMSNQISEEYLDAIEETMRKLGFNE